MQFKATILLLAVAFAVATASPVQLINLYADQFNLDASIQTLVPLVGDSQEKLEQIAQCYEPSLVGENVNIFDQEASVKSIVEKYYKAFPHKTITKESIGQLIVSISEIINTCLSTETQTIKYGFTELSDMTDAQMQGLTGLQRPNFNSSMGKTTWYDGSDSECQRSGASIPDSFDWREHNVVTSVKNQGQCGSCWTFATVGSIESSYLINRRTSDVNINLSEQQIVDCAKDNGCQGGNSMTAFYYVQSHGLTSEQQYPYEESDNGCENVRYQTAATISDFCVRSYFRYASDFHSEDLSDQDIQESLVNYGPLYITLNANTAWTRNYRGGVVTGGCNTQTNHAVLLVGYTSNAWIIKNSWGGSWGESGYFRLARGRNLCGINTEVAWPLL